MEEKKDIFWKWIEKKGLSISEAARQSGLSRQLISKHKLHPEMSWQPNHAIMIERYTKGEVSAVSCITQGLLKGKSKTVRVQIETMIAGMLNYDDPEITGEPS